MEMEALKNYLQQYSIEDLILELTEAILKDKPPDPRKYLLGKLEEEVGDGRAREVATEATSIGQVPSHYLVQLFECTRSITAEIVPKETIDIIIRETVKILSCDRVSLFVYSPKLNMLVLTASNLSKPIRVKVGQGIAGHVFETQETINIPDCYQDDRFDSGFDKRTGYHTKSLLTMPIVDFENETMGVLQAINKADGQAFSQIDELLMGHLTQHAGIALRNAEVYRDAIIASERANGLLHVIQALTEDLGTQSTILTITMHATELVQSDRCTVFMVDGDQLWSVATDTGTEIRIPKTAGIAGECFTTASTINIPDAYADSRFNQEIDKKTGYLTQSLLCVPIRNQEKILGVIQMINKVEFDGDIGSFADDDQEVMETFAKFVGGKLVKTANLKVGGGRNSKTMEHGEANAISPRGSFNSSSKPKRNFTHENAIIEEGDEEEEEEDP